MKIANANKWLIGVASTALISSAAMWEGEKNEPYLDVGGIPTVCMGYTGKDITWGKHYSHEECNGLLRKELVDHANGVLNCITQPLAVNEYNSFTLMAYNIGVVGFCSSRTARLFNEGKRAEACDAIAFSPNKQPNWSYVNGKFVKGLFNRRLYERSMCLGKGVLYAS
jgi:lysozyme